ncbi:MAG: pseudouridine synthase [Hyphomicrobiaceae bacterium]
MRKGPSGQAHKRPSDRAGKQKRAATKRAGQSRDEKGDPKPSAKSPAREDDQTRMRIAKAIARAGLCSRRDAERWIGEGRVVVNGETLASPARDVSPADSVIVDGRPLPKPEPVRMWRYHKPRGLVTTHRDPQGRPTVFDSLPADLPRVISVGRLDYNTEGLLLLTTDGDLARHIELPATGWLRRYRVRAHGRVSQADLDALKDGITIEGARYGSIEATIDSVQGGNCWLTIGLREGKNREVRKVLDSLGLKVNRLIRISFGPFQLLNLEAGRAELIKTSALAEHLGKDLAGRFGLERKTQPTAASRVNKRPAPAASGKRRSRRTAPSKPSDRPA